MSDKTLLERMEDGLDKQIVAILENGVAETDAEGNVVTGEDNKPVTAPPPAAFLNMVRQRINDLKGKGDGGDDKDEMEKIIAEAIGEGGRMPPLDMDGGDRATP